MNKKGRIGIGIAIIAAIALIFLFNPSPAFFIPEDLGASGVFYQYAGRQPAISGTRYDSNTQGCYVWYETAKYRSYQDKIKFSDTQEIALGNDKFVFSMFGVRQRVECESANLGKEMASYTFEARKNGQLVYSYYSPLDCIQLKDVGFVSPESIEKTFITDSGNITVFTNLIHGSINEGEECSGGEPGYIVNKYVVKEFSSSSTSQVSTDSPKILASPSNTVFANITEKPTNFFQKFFSVIINFFRGLFG